VVTFHPPRVASVEANGIAVNSTKVESHRAISSLEGLRCRSYNSAALVKLRSPVYIFRLLAVIGLVALAGCGDKSPGGSAPAKSAHAVPDAPAAHGAFTEIAKRAGIDFRHVNGMSGEFYYPEVIGAGVALFDFDSDGKLDVLILQGQPLAPTASVDTGACTAKLYRNALDVRADGTRDLRFTDVTATTKLCSHGYAMGVAIGDYDNDGYPDVFITHFGAPNQLFHNNGDGTFTDVTQKAGVGGDGRWGSSATFFDLDGDGRLDLYVANYVDYSLANNQKCFASTSARDYCAPSGYKPVPGMLYRNRGDGTFEDVSVKAGITKAFGAGLGVMAVDFNDDDWPDLYVANDGNPNQLWINQKDGTFRNEADVRGAAVNADGMAEAGMGIDIGDFDGNGSDDIFLTHLTREKSTMFVNRGQGYFEDRSVEVGVAVPSIPFTGFGTAFLDYDNDGWLDVVAANGAVHLIEELRARGDPYPLHQRKQLFHNLGNGHFEEATAAGGAAFELSEVGRGLAAGDLDNDGGVDFVVNNNNGPFRVFHNDIGAASNWLGLRLLSGKRDAYGARVEVRRADLPVIWRRVRADGSYLSANDSRVVVGLGKQAKVDALVVHWPDRIVESFDVPSLGRYTTLVEGSGRKEAK
jgi:enediyne biosynthesis protein E4